MGPVGGAAAKAAPSGQAAEPLHERAAREMAKKEASDRCLASPACCLHAGCRAAAKARGQAQPQGSNSSKARRHSRHTGGGTA